MILLEQLKGGSPEAFDAFYKKYRHWLKLVALTVLQDEMEAQDLVQDFFIDFWQKKLYENIHVSVKSFLYMSIRNKSLNKLEHNAVVKRRTEAALYQAPELPDNIHDREQLALALKSAMEQVPPKSAKVLKLIYFEHKTRKEVAEEMGISPSTVKHQLARALKILKKKLKQNRPLSY